MEETGKISYSSFLYLGAVVEAGVVPGKTKTRTGKVVCQMLFHATGMPLKKKKKEKIGMESSNSINLCLTVKDWYYPFPNLQPLSKVLSNPHLIK